MNDYIVLRNYLDYKTKYFDSFSQFVKIHKYVNGEFISVFCNNIRSINAHFNDFLFFLNSDTNCCNLDVIILTENWHNVEYCNFKIVVVVVVVSDNKNANNNYIK
jgi:hypothetical protein